MEAGRQWRAKDIGIQERACAWMPHGFMSVNTKLGAGRAFLRSLYKQYADWGVDFGNLNFKRKQLYLLYMPFGNYMKSKFEEASVLLFPRITFFFFLSFSFENPKDHCYACFILAMRVRAILFHEGVY